MFLSGIQGQAQSPAGREKALGTSPRAEPVHTSRGGGEKGRENAVAKRRTVDSGQWTVDCGQWAVVCGLWSLDSRQWSVVRGQWAVEGGHVETSQGQAEASSLSPAAWGI